METEELAEVMLAAAGSRHLLTGVPTKNPQGGEGAVDLSGNPTGQKPPSGKVSAGKLGGGGTLGIHQKAASGVMLNSLEWIPTGFHLVAEHRRNQERSSRLSPEEMPAVRPLPADLNTQRMTKETVLSQAPGVGLELNPGMITGPGTRC